MANQVGMVFVDLEGCTSRSGVRRLLDNASSRVPEGRHLVAIWKASSAWGKHLPLESIVTDEILGVPADRHDSSWEFFGNGITRAYRSGSTTPTTEVPWLIFRRTGDKPYIRRKTVPNNVLASSTLRTLDKVFTRDIANNVWHLPLTRARKATIDRLQSLLSWSDESALLVTSRGMQKRLAHDISYDLDLIGRAQKVPYFFQSANVALDPEDNPRLFID